MITLSAFADEIGPEPELQIETLRAHGIRHIEFRAIHGKGVLELSDAEVREFRRQLDDAGFALSAIGSPIGKIGINDDFGPHLDQYKRCIDLAHMMNTRYIRLFSYYYPEGEDPANYRSQVLDRMNAKAELAVEAGIVMRHENESGIYGDTADRCVDLLTGVESEGLEGCFDFANFVHIGEKPLEIWPDLKPLTQQFHIKDFQPGSRTACPAGEGEGHIEQIVGDAVASGFEGFCTMEPHLQVAGKMAGFTGPQLFATAVDAFKAILDRLGAEYN